MTNYAAISSSISRRELLKAGLACSIGAGLASVLPAAVAPEAACAS